MADEALATARAGSCAAPAPALTPIGDASGCGARALMARVVWICGVVRGGAEERGHQSMALGVVHFQVCGPPPTAGEREATVFQRAPAADV